MRNFTTSVLCLVLLALCFASRSEATHYKWVEKEDGNWNDATKWDPPAVPTELDSVEFPEGQYTVQLDTNVTVAQFTFYRVHLVGSGGLNVTNSLLLSDGWVYLNHVYFGADSTIIKNGEIEVEQDILIDSQHIEIDEFMFTLSGDKSKVHINPSGSEPAYLSGTIHVSAGEFVISSNYYADALEKLNVTGDMRINYTEGVGNTTLASVILDVQGDLYLEAGFLLQNSTVHANNLILNATNSSSSFHFFDSAVIVGNATHHLSGNLIVSNAIDECALESPTIYFGNVSSDSELLNIKTVFCSTNTYINGIFDADFGEFEFRDGNLTVSYGGQLVISEGSVKVSDKVIVTEFGYLNFTADPATLEASNVILNGIVGFATEGTSIIKGSVSIKAFKFVFGGYVKIEGDLETHSPVTISGTVVVSGSYHNYNITDLTYAPSSYVLQPANFTNAANAVLKVRLGTAPGTLKTTGTFHNEGTIIATFTDERRTSFNDPIECEHLVLHGVLVVVRNEGVIPPNAPYALVRNSGNGEASITLDSHDELAKYELINSPSSVVIYPHYNITLLLVNETESINSTLKDIKEKPVQIKSVFTNFTNIPVPMVVSEVRFTLVNASSDNVTLEVNRNYTSGVHSFYPVALNESLVQFPLTVHVKVEFTDIPDCQNEDHVGNCTADVFVTLNSPHPPTKSDNITLIVVLAVVGGIVVTMVLISLVSYMRKRRGDGSAHSSSFYTSMT